ncbi:MAG: hypothetical protein QUS14_01530 [Pyrinomonadaceae bacterium]|nr:hypothetical protein [Pyrinomonadaceae bacterium]
MRSRPIIRTLALLIALIYPQWAAAFETDQYNLPPVPLADIGDEVTEYVEEKLRDAIAELNEEIAENEACRERSCRKAKERLRYLRSEEALAREVFKRLGDGIVPFTKSGTWMNRHKFRGQPARYTAGYSESIYAIIPTNYFTISPTVKIYGVEMGTDKIAHLFQQGYTYYRIYTEAVAKGSTHEAATAKAVKWGRQTEHTYYGTLVSGVYSNADLFANYVGMEFYQGLARETTVAGVPRPAIAEFADGRWRLANGIDITNVLIKPYMTEHMNEALNPSMYIAGLRSSVRKKVRKRSCPQWLSAFPLATRDTYARKAAELETWHGLDYGHRRNSEPVSIAATCYSTAN